MVCDQLHSTGSRHKSDFHNVEVRERIYIIGPFVPTLCNISSLRMTVRANPESCKLYRLSNYIVYTNIADMKQTKKRFILFVVSKILQKIMRDVNASTECFPQCHCYPFVPLCNNFKRAFKQKFTGFSEPRI